MKEYSALIFTPYSMNVETVMADNKREAEEKMQEKLKEAYPAIYKYGWTIQPSWLNEGR